MPPLTGRPYRCWYLPNGRLQIAPNWNVGWNVDEKSIGTSRSLDKSLCGEGPADLVDLLVRFNPRAFADCAIGEPRLRSNQRKYLFAVRHNPLVPRARDSCPESNEQRRPHIRVRNSSSSSWKSWRTAPCAWSPSTAGLTATMNPGAQSGFIYLPTLRFDRHLNGEPSRNPEN